MTDPWEWLAGAAIAFAVTMLTTPAGVSGAVFLLPVQVSVLHVPNPSLTPTNLLYNVLSTPGALARFGREQGLVSPVTRALLAGTIPGVVAGAVLRVSVVSGAGAFLVVVACVLAPLGAWLAWGGIRPPSMTDPEPDRRLTRWAFAAGVIGGVYGIGGGSLLGPLLAYKGFSMYVVAPAALTTTFVTSVVGVAAFQVLEILDGGGPVAADWPLGLCMGLGGLCGSYLGARVQHRIPEYALRRLLGVACLLLSARYAFDGLRLG